MKKIDYQAPEMKIIEVKYQGPLMSSEEAGGGSDVFSRKDSFEED